MQSIKIFFVSIVLFMFLSSFNCIKKEEIKWLNFTKLAIAYKKQPKPIIIDVYTSWCGWCKVMDRDTYANEKVASYINQKYYAIKFNAEEQNAIEFNQKKYEYNSQYKVNNLAIFLLGGQLSYPTTVLLTSINAMPQPIAGYLKPPQLEIPLKFFGEDVYKSQSFQDYIKGFSTSW